MKASNRICLAVFIITIIFTIVSFIFLPDTVRIQHSTMMDSSTDVPKFWGILLAASLSIGGAVGVLVSKKPETQKCGILVITVIGYILFANMFIGSLYI